MSNLNGVIINPTTLACPCCGWNRMHDTTIRMAKMVARWCNGNGKNKLNLAWYMDSKAWPYVLDDVTRALIRDRSEYALHIMPDGGCVCPKRNAEIGGAEDSWHLPRAQDYYGSGEKWDIVDGSHGILFERDNPDRVYAHALSFQVWRREWKVPSNYVGALSKERFWTPWAPDLAATRACSEFWKPIWTLGGWGLKSEECRDCKGDGRQPGEEYAPSYFDTFECPTCQGTGKQVWIEMHTGGGARLREGGVRCVGTKRTSENLL